MRVLMIVNGFPNDKDPHRGIFNFRAAKEIARHCDIEVVTLRTWVPGRKVLAVEDYQGITVVTVCLPLAHGNVRLSLILAKIFGGFLLRRHLDRADVIHSVGAEFVGILSAAWAENRKLRHVAQVISNFQNAVPPIQSRPYFRKFTENVDAIATNSVALSYVARGLFPCVKDVRAVFRGVDLQEFCPGGARHDFQDFDERWCALQGPRFLFLGGLPKYKDRYGDNKKGGRTLMKSWRFAEHVLHQAEASLIFAGPSSERGALGPWRESLKYPHLVEVRNRISPDQIPRLMRSVDVVLVPSLDEGLPNCATEAAASGKAVFGSAIGGICDVVDHKKTGLLLPPGDPRSWAKALERTCEPGGDRWLKDLGQQARKKMESSFCHRTFADTMMELYACH